ncbi:MAG: peptidylprolyl isomerase [Flavobacteriales bacterium]|nr:peptidylprolyl isomerase [Flavobacteriales bacterium]
MKYIYLYIFCFIFSNLFSQDQVFLSIADEQISIQDFMKTYHKNRLDTDTLSFNDSLDEYLQLYIKFKLKVIEAEQLGLDTIPAFIRELDGYRRQLVKPYLTDASVSEQLLKEAYERLKYEVSVSHILIQADPNDTIEAYNTILGIRERIANGEDFVSLAKTFSEDPSVKENNGDLGYFTALYMVYPFETAAYETKVGSVSEPVKTRFGYHVIKVNDKRASRGEVKVAHIMIRIDDKQQNSQNLSKDKIYEIYDSLIVNSGSNFGELAQKYSDDKKSGSKGGTLDWFGTNKMVKNFEEAAFDLDSIGSFSEPFQTEFGWHIVKLLEKKSLPDFDQMYSDLKKKIERDSRSQKTRNVVIDRLKSEWGFVENQKSKNLFYKIIDDNFLNGGDILQYLNGKGHVMFVFNSSDDLSQRYIYQKDFAEYLMKYRNRFSKTTNTKTIIDQFYNTFKEQNILDIEMNNLEYKYDDFRLLIDEYHDGILLFNLSEEKVWNKAIQDTVGLLHFYDENQDKYMWSNRVSARIYSAKDINIRKRVVNYLKRGGDEANLLERINKKSALNLSLEEGVYELGDNSIIDDNIFSMELNDSKKSDVILIEDSNQIIIILDIIPPSVKPLDQIKGLVISDYQNLLEEKWVDDLKSNYIVSVNDDLFSLAKKNQISLNENNLNLIESNLDCNDFLSCFTNTGKFFGYSQDVYFGWNNQIYTTEIKPVIGNDK